MDDCQCGNITKLKKKKTLMYCSGLEQVTLVYLKDFEKIEPFIIYSIIYKNGENIIY